MWFLLLFTCEQISFVTVCVHSIYVSVSCRVANVHTIKVCIFVDSYDFIDAFI